MSAAEIACFSRLTNRGAAPRTSLDWIGLTGSDRDMLYYLENDHFATELCVVVLLSGNVDALGIQKGRVQLYVCQMWA